MTDRLNRTARAALLLSLLMNVVLAVLLAMHMPWRLRGEERGSRRVGPVPELLDVRAFKRSLPHARQQAFDHAVEGNREEMRKRLQTLFEARRAVRREMRAEPFDRAALDAAFGQLREAETAAASQAQRMLGDVLATATPDERRRFAELMPQRPRHRREQRRDEQREREPPAIDPPPASSAPPGDR